MSFISKHSIYGYKIKFVPLPLNLTLLLYLENPMRAER